MIKNYNSTRPNRAGPANRKLGSVITIQLKAPVFWITGLYACNLRVRVTVTPNKERVLNKNELTARKTLHFFVQVMPNYHVFPCMCVCRKDITMHRTLSS